MINEETFYIKIEKKYAIIVFLQALLSLYLIKGNLTFPGFKVIPKFCGEIYTHLYELHQKCFPDQVDNLQTNESRKEVEYYKDCIKTMMDIIMELKLGLKPKTVDNDINDAIQRINLKKYRIETESGGFDLNKVGLEENEFISNHKINKMFIEGGEIDIEVCKKRLDEAVEKIGELPQGLDQLAHEHVGTEDKFLKSILEEIYKEIKI